MIADNYEKTYSMYVRVLCGITRARSERGRCAKAARAERVSVFVEEEHPEVSSWNRYTGSKVGSDNRECLAS